MATRSLIATKLPDGKFRSIYCHFDGYPDHNGKILAEHYNTPEKIEALFALGSLSFLGEKLAKDNEKDRNNYCTAYHRDCGEKWEHNAPRTYDTLADLIRAARDSFGVDYVYVFESGAWAVCRPYAKEIKMKTIPEVLAEPF